MEVKNRRIKQRRYLFEVFIIILFIGEHIVVSIQEPCETNNFIDDYKRSTAYVPKDGNFICDSFIFEDWYRIVSGSGELMPTVCISGFRCGTVQPIWLSNDGVQGNIYPAPGIEVNRTAYVVDDINCRSEALKISIKNCGPYFVYKLKKPVGCDKGFCFGSELPCPHGQTSETGFTPNCTDVFPNVTFTPQLTVGFHTVTEGTKVTKTPMFRCTSDDATDEYNYDIVYYINDVPISDATYRNVGFNDFAETLLLQHHWEKTFQPNMLVKCSIQARFVDRGGPGNKTYSDIFFAGIKVLEDGVITVKEGETRTISLQSTLPIGCTYNLGPNEHLYKTACNVLLYNGIPKYQSNGANCALDTDDSLDFSTEACVLKLNHTNWDGVYHITVTGKSDSLINMKDRIVFLRLYTTKESSNSMEVLLPWNSITLSDIMIYIKDTDERKLYDVCYSRNDPHMKTFSGKKYEFQKSEAKAKGEFIFYKHNRLPQQVNIYIQQCSPGSNAFCNCAIAIRSADSLFRVNFCETNNSKGERKTNRYIVSRFCDNQNMIVQEPKENVFVVTLPSKTEVEFVVADNVFPAKVTISSIEIRPTTLDVKLTSGLCGLYFTRSADDTYIASYNFLDTVKVENSQSLFSPTNLPPLTYKLQEYCTCKLPPRPQPGNTYAPEFICELSDRLQACRQIEIQRNVHQSTCLSSTYRSKRSVSIGRERRSIDGEENDGAPAEYEMFAGDPDPIEGSDEWRNGLTEEIAKERCERHLTELPAFSLCESYVATVNPSDFVDECVVDMKLTGSDAFLKATLQNFQISCLQSAKKMENLTATNTTNAPGESKTIFSIIAETTCLNNCSGKGDCIESGCKCKNGFFGEDCSLNISSVPTIIPAAFADMCDIQKRACMKFAIPGSSFLSANLSCGFKRFTITSNNSIVHEMAYDIYPGIYSSSFMMYCQLPQPSRFETSIVSGLHISVSNDGFTFTDSLTVLVYHTECFSCITESLTCEKKKICPEISNDDSDSKSDRTGIIVGIAVVGALIIIVILVIIVKKNCIKRHQNVYDSTTNLPNPHYYSPARQSFHYLDLLGRSQTSLDDRPYDEIR